jgi:hypothetical protein
MRALARTHDWVSLVDLSGLPTGAHWLGRTGLRRPLRAIDTRVSVRSSRVRLARCLNIPTTSQGIVEAVDAVVDELYINCLHHADIQMLYTLLPSARKIYVPHGFDCLQEAEIFYYSPHLATDSLGARARTLDAVKRVLLGNDSLPTRRVTLDLAITFNLDAPWADTVRLGDRLTRDTMARLFTSMDDEAQRYFLGIADAAGTNAALLMLTPRGWLPPDRVSDELRVYCDTAEYVLRKTGAEVLLVKPHPRASIAWTEQVLTEVRNVVSGVDVIPLSSYAAYPVEVIASCLPFSGCAGFGSSSLRTLSRLYHVPAFCPERALRELLQDRPADLAAWDAWATADHGGRYVAI